MASFYERFLKKKPKQSRSRAAVDAILTAALDRISRIGEQDGVNVQDVAERAGVGIGSLYDYFNTRGDLLAAATMKAAQDNLDTFDALLADSEALPLRAAIERVVDGVLDIYGADRDRYQSVLRLTMRLDLVPTLAMSQSRFAASLADLLRRRPDVHVADVDATAWVVTHSMMGIAHTLIWEPDPPPRAAIREAAVAAFTAALTAHDASA